MELKVIGEKDKDKYNSLITHIIQSWEWGEFRKKLGVPLERYGLFEGKKLTKTFQITFHKIPFTKQFVGYLPKGPFPDKDFANALVQIGKEKNCAFIKIEPDVEMSKLKSQMSKVDVNFKPSKKPLFTKYNFILDLTKSEEELLKGMHPKTRYNINLAKKKGVVIKEGLNEEFLEIYLKLYFETTKRQNYLGHNEIYHKLVFETLKKEGMARILIAFYKDTPLASWMLLNFKDTLYYPYGGSSILHKDLMASNLLAWEAVKLGKKLGLKKFDLWGALGPDPDESDPWFGFHKFKKGYGGKLIEYIGSFDIIFNKPLYLIFNTVDSATKLKVLLLKAFS